MDAATFIKLAKEKYGDVFDYSRLSQPMKFRKPEVIVCKKHGQFTKIPRDLLRTVRGCPHCYLETKNGVDPKRIERYVEKAKNKFKNVFDYTKVEFNSTIDKEVVIGCPHHGYFTSRIDLHLKSFCGCPHCALEKTVRDRTKYKQLSDLIPSAIKVHGDLYEYLEINHRERTVVYMCRTCGRVEQLIRSHLSGRGCNNCRYDKLRLTKEQFVERARSVHPEGYTYALDELKSVNDKITITHYCGHVYKGRVSNHLSGQGCVRCKVSVGETQVGDWLTSRNIRYVSQFKLEGHVYRYDFYLPDLNILIEYDGEQHFRSVPFFGGQKGFDRRKYNDKTKNYLAKKYGYFLIRVPYTELGDLGVFLSRAIDKYFRYYIDGVFYRKYPDLAKAMKLPYDSPVRNMEAQRTFKVLSPLN